MFLSTYKVINYANLCKCALFLAPLLGEQIWCLNMKSIKEKTLLVNAYNLSSGHMDPYTNCCI